MFLVPHNLFLSSIINWHVVLIITWMNLWLAELTPFTLRFNRFQNQNANLFKIHTNRKYGKLRNGSRLSFWSRFSLSGSWSGSGQAYVTKYGDISANCRVAITGAETKVAMNGSCGMLVFRQALGLSIRNAGGNRYVGTYTGSKTGPAKLEGALHG